MIKNLLLFSTISFLSAGAVHAADAPKAVKPEIAKICTNCHKAEQNVLRGYFDSVAFKSKTIQMKIDDSVHLIKFDEDDIKVLNKDGKSGDGELMKSNKIAKGQEIRIEYQEKNGEKIAVKLTEKPPVKVAPEMLYTTEDVQKLIKAEGKKSKHYIFDSRPLPRFQEGYIPTALNLPFPAFDKLAPTTLPADKNALILFYCAGPQCNMSPSSAVKAKQLGYKNLKVYKDGMPAWLEKNYGIISSKFLKDAWIDKDITNVLLDVRQPKTAEKGFIKGAVAFPAKSADKLIKELTIKKNAPIMVYDQKNSKDAKSVASKLVAAGFKRVLVLEGGYDGWSASKYPVQTGKLSAKASYSPKPKVGEINIDEFKKYAAELPPNVMIIDVRNSDEGNSGMLKTAKLIPAEDIKNRLTEIPKDKLVITHCATGIRAEMAYHALKEAGYSNIKFVNAKLKFEKDGKYEITKE